MKKKTVQQGFTLIEILAVMMVFGIIGGVAAATLVTSLRTSNKSAILTTVKQNGDYAITQMVRVIRNAYDLKTPNLPCGTESSPTLANSITFVDSSNTATTFTCTGPTDNPPYSITMVQGTGTPSGTPISLLDTTQVKTSTCSFSCTQISQSNYPIIGITFSLLQKSTSSFVEQIASASAINFSTSVIFRNYQR